jgi:hypothetical protein
VARNPGTSTTVRCGGATAGVGAVHRRADGGRSRGDSSRQIGGRNDRGTSRYDATRARDHTGPPGDSLGTAQQTLDHVDDALLSGRLELEVALQLEVHQPTHGGPQRQRQTSRRARFTTRRRQRLDQGRTRPAQTDRLSGEGTYPRKGRSNITPYNSGRSKALLRYLSAQAITRSVPAGIGSTVRSEGLWHLEDGGRPAGRVQVAGRRRSVSSARSAWVFMFSSLLTTERTRRSVSITKVVRALGSRPGRFTPKERAIFEPSSESSG